MRTAGFGAAVSAAVAVLLAGCAAGPTAVPSAPDSAPPTTGPTAATPPVAAELTGGTALQLGSAGHWAIADRTAFVASTETGVTAIDLATGDPRWQAGFSLGEPWEAQPNLGVSADRSVVVAVRTVDAGDAAAVDLLLLDAGSGAKLAEHLITDPAGRWRIDLPPRVLAADRGSVVLADNPESGRQTAVVDLAAGALAWQVEDQAVAATADTVVTRAAGWNRGDGTRRWQAAGPLGPLLAQSPTALVVQQDGRAGWLDPVTGSLTPSTADLGEAEPPCVATADTLVCLGAQVTGYDLASAAALWASPGPADALAGWGSWLYLWRGDGRGDVLDARTGRPLVTDAALPSLRYADDHGVLLSAENGYSWVSFPG